MVKAKNEISRLQTALVRLSEADAMLKESREEIMAINMSKQATEDEKAILQHACTRFNKFHRCSISHFVTLAQVHRVH